MNDEFFCCIFIQHKGYYYDKDLKRNIVDLQMQFCIHMLLEYHIHIYLINGVDKLTDPKKTG